MMFGLHAHHHAAGMVIADFTRRSFASEQLSVICDLEPMTID